MRTVKKLALTFIFILSVYGLINACTSIVVTKGASADGSVINSYLCDGEFLSRLRIIPAATHKPGEVQEIKDFRGNVIARIPYPPRTYHVVGLMNEYQLSIGETTFGGREELGKYKGGLHYFNLIILTLQRAKTAREAIKTIASLANTYGYSGPGETFSIADKNEVWIMEFIGKGADEKGIVWVARRVPDGHISVHANQARIREIDFDDPENFMYSKDVVSFAVKKGYYDPKSGKPFSFADVYDPPDAEKLRFCARRVWRVLSRVAPGLKLSPAYSSAVKGAKPYPFSVRPEKKLSVRDVMALLRDHYEGTSFDMRKGIDAGPFHCPYRWRPLTWKLDGKTYGWQRPVSVQQTSFSFISQARAWLPDAIGGVYWYSPDDTYTNCYVPFYVSIIEIPERYGKGDIRRFSWDSAWWIFNVVANLAYMRYDDMVKDIQKVQKAFEEEFFAMQPAVEKIALELYKKDPEFAVKFLTQYSVSAGNRVLDRWIKLWEELVTKYNDGYVKDEKGRPKAKGYPEDWLRKVIKENERKFLIKEKSKKK